MDNATYRKIGRRKAGTWAGPHQDLKADAHRGARRIAERELEKEIQEAGIRTAANIGEMFLLAGRVLP